MASALQSAVTDIQLNNYVTGMLLRLCNSGPLVSLLPLVAALSAVGYDYGKRSCMSMCDSSHWCNFGIVSAHILRRGMSDVESKDMEIFTIGY